MGKIKIVSASAGSGKTYNLAYEYVRNVIENPSLYRNILAVTFTNKATEEMKQRILSKIDELATGSGKDFLSDLRKDTKLPDNIIGQRAAEARSRILHDYNHFAILTIDKFFQKIIRSFIKELGIEVNFNLELPTETLLSGATDRLIDESAQNDNLREWLISFINERMDDNKQWNIRHEIESLGVEVFKEEFRTSRISASRDVIDSLVKSIIKEGEKAKAEITACAQKALRFLNENDIDPDDFSQKNRGVGGFIVKNASGELTSPNSYVAKALEDGDWCPAKSGKRELIDSVRDELHSYVQHIADAYREGIVKVNTASLLRRNYRSFALLGDLKAKIDELSREENIVHISEINAMLSQLIEDNDAPFIFEKAGNYYSHYMIDEFQDTSTLQWRNFVPLLSNAVSQSSGTPVMLVGDIKQSIYRWRGGDWKILANDASAEFDETETISLLKNYRSSRTVVDFNNALIGAVVASEDAGLDAALQKAEDEGSIGPQLARELKGLASKAYSDYIQEPQGKSDSGYVTITYYPKNDSGPTSSPVIERIEELQSRGYRAREIAILVRTNIQATQIANMLLEYKTNHPGSPYCYDVVSQDALIIGRAPVCGFVIACLCLADKISDSISRAVYNRRMGYPFERELSEDERSFFGHIRLQSPEEAFEAIVIRFNLGGDRHEAAYLQALHEQIISFTSSNIADIPLFIEWWDKTGNKKSIAMPSGGNAITIDTIHRSKGLGYRVVIIPYCNWTMNAKPDSVVWAASEKSRRHFSEIRNDNAVGAFPIGYSRDMANSAFGEDYYREYVMSHIDNLNLFYVAVTRARDELHIMMPEPSKNPSSETIARLVTENIVMNGNGGAAINDSYRGRTSVEDSGATLFEFGEPAEIEAKTVGGDPEFVNVDFRSHDIAGRVKVSVSSQRYIDDGAGDGRMSPRNYGILMHRVFEYAGSLDDINRNLSRLIANGDISQVESETLSHKIKTAFGDGRIAGWFCGDWDEVRNENDIIMPGKSSYRPDRVMIKDRRAVIVDYKFGVKEDKNHSRQIAGYMSVLAGMGYAPEGYIWYVNLGKTVEV